MVYSLVWFWKWTIFARRNLWTFPFQSFLSPIQKVSVCNNLSRRREIMHAKPCWPAIVKTSNKLLFIISMQGMKLHGRWKMSMTFPRIESNHHWLPYRPITTSMYWLRQAFSHNGVVLPTFHKMCFHPITSSHSHSIIPEQGIESIPFRQFGVSECYSRSFTLVCLFHPTDTSPASDPSRVFCFSWLLCEKSTTQTRPTAT